MNDSAPRRYFSEPSCPAQRQYEALRAVFVEGVTQKEAAERFGYSHGAFRLIVMHFRSALADGTAPPFSADPRRAARPDASRGRRAPTSRPSPTPAA